MYPEEGEILMRARRNKYGKEKKKEANAERVGGASPPSSN